MSTQVGSASVAIFPIFKGFRRITDKAVQSATDSAGKLFSQGFNKNAQQTGTSSGKAFSQGFNEGFTTTAPKTMASLQSSVAAASKALSSARLSEADALGKVNVAQATYGAAQKKYASDSPQVIKAFESLSSSQRRYAAAQDVTTAATSRLKGAQSQLAGALDVVEKKPSGIGNAFMNLGGAIQGGFSNLAGLAVNVIGGAVQAAVGIATAGAITVTAAIGGIVAAGFTRLSSIQTAQAKLKALGNTQANIAEIMKNANDAVIGTQYSLADAVTAAAQAVAAGIKPGQQLTDYLKLNANAAAVAGVAFGDLGLVMNQVRSQGHAYTQDLNQIASRGIPIWQGLQEVYGVTRDKLSEMVRDGSIDADHFEAALRLKVGNAADEIGKTTVGSFENMQAAVSRFGAALIGPAFPIAERVFTGITTGLDKLKAAVQPLVDKYGPGLASAFQGILDKAGPFLDQFVQKVVDWANSPAGTQFFSDLSTNVGLMGDAIVKGMPGFLSFVTGMAQLIGYVTLFATSAAPGFIDSASQVLGIAGLIGSNFATVFQRLSDGSIWDVIGSKFQNGLQQISDFFTTWFQNLGPGLANGWQQITDAFGNGWQQIIDGFPVWLGQVGEAFGHGWQQITDAFGNGWQQWQDKAANGWNQLVEKFNNGGQQILGAFNNGWNQITGAFSNGWNQLTGAFANGWNQLATAARTGVNTIVNVASSIYTKIRDFFNGAGDWLYNAGKSIIDGLISGIRDMIGAAGKAAGDVMSAISNFFPHSPAKEGPFSGRGWTPYRGQALMEGFASGITSRTTYARAAALSAVGSVADALTGTIPGQIGVSASSSAPGASSGVAGRTAPLIGTVVAPDQNPEVSGRIIGEEIDRLLTGTGL